MSWHTRTLSWVKEKCIIADRPNGGFSLIEVLVAMALLSVVMLSLSYNVIVSYRLMKRNERNSIAQQLAFEKMEQLAAVRPLSLSSANDLTETKVRSNISFTRTTTVLVNTDTSRTVTVSVNNNVHSLGGSASVTNTFVSWVRE